MPFVLYTNGLGRLLLAFRESIPPPPVMGLPTRDDRISPTSRGSTGKIMSACGALNATD
jgi:hypothetical protein